MDYDKLKLWQDRLARSEAAYSDEYSRMDERDAMYSGDREIRTIVRDDCINRETPLVHNIVAETIEAMVSSTIPSPKVTPLRAEDERLAHIIEEMLRDELDRLCFEEINDIQERTVPLQGGAYYLVEWDSESRSHNTIGDISVTAVHPRMVVPQDGIYGSIEDMDYVILKVPQTKEYIRRRYGEDVSFEGEADPTVRDGTGRGVTSSDELVTQYTAYYRNRDGGIGVYSWVCDTELEDIDDYQAHRRERCKACLKERSADEYGTKEPCRNCGGKEFEAIRGEYEEVWEPIRQSDGSFIPGATELDVPDGFDSFFRPLSHRETVPTEIPYYEPLIYPLILQRNVSKYGQLLGSSDCDQIADQQNAVKRLDAKMMEKILKSGSYITLPPEASVATDGEDMKVIRLNQVSDKSYIDVYTLEGDVSQDLENREYIYQTARNILGITDSYQGRTDSTATSGKAKEFAAAQSAGRLESKRIMKNAAYSKLFETIFKFKLAYADEPRPVLSHDQNGNAEYLEFNRYDFLAQDENGEWYWNDAFLFTCDTSAPLASNREAMWQETRMNFESGAFGNPAELVTLILFWSKMEMLHYPGAGETKAYLEAQYREQQAQQQAAMQQAAIGQAVPGQAVDGVSEADVDAVVRQATADAARDAGAQA